ncbi:MAG: hypothetical protein M0030_22890 [Actinomycetota bacterium]|nr:hypothetical protein [Actinomycetota bacterium]
MEASEAVRRIVWRHRWLLLVCMLIPAAAIVPYRVSRPATWSATATIQAQAAAPDVSTQVLAITSRVTAVATSPQTVRAALSAAGVNRNPVQVAHHEITVTSLSSSAIVSLTVTDPSRQVALRLSRALALVVVNALNSVGAQSSSQLAVLAKQHQALEVTRHGLLAKLLTAQARNEATTSAGVQALITELSAVESELSANQAAAQQIQTNSSANQGAGIISYPDQAKSQSRHVAVYALLAALAGLIVALLIGAVRELIRPTIAQPAAGARELSLVLLGTAAVDRSGAASVEDDLPTKLGLAAHRIDAATLVLTGPVPAARLSQLAQELNQSLPAGPEAGAPRKRGGRISAVTALPSVPSQGDREPGGNGSGGNGSGGNGSGEPVGRLTGMGLTGMGLTVTALPDITLASRPADPALVLVLPPFAPRPALEDAVDISVTTGWPMLGVIGLAETGPRRRFRRRNGPSTAATAEPPAGVAPGQDDAGPAEQRTEEKLGAAR